MARKPKLDVNLDDLKEDEFYKATKLIKSTLNSNIGSFTGLPVDIATYGPLITTFDDKRTAAYYSGQAAEVAAARTALQTATTTNGTWLNNFCAGNLVLLKKTGYPLVKEAEAQGKLDPTVLTLKILTIMGSIGFLISHIAGTGIRYGIMYTLESNPENDPSKWTFYYSAQRDGVLAGLESKKNYKMVSFAMGTDKDITYSDPVIISAQ